MPSLPDRLKLLRREPAAAVAALCAAALPRAEPHERPPLFEAALAGRDPGSHAAAIAVLHQLGSTALRAAVEVRADLRPALERLAGPQAILNGIAVARARGDSALLEPLVGWLGHDSPDVSRRAAEALLAIVTANAGLDGRRSLAPAISRRLDEAVAAAIAGPQSRHLDAVAVAGALLSSRPGPRMAAVLADPDHALLLRRAAGRIDREVVRRNLLRWLTIDPLGRSAARRLNQVEGRRRYAELLDAGHLLLTPARRRAVRLADRPARCLPDPATAATLPDRAQAHLVRLARALGPRHRKPLEDCLDLPCATARILAAVEMCADGGASGRLCLSNDEPIAWLGCDRVLRRCGRRDEALIDRLEAGPHRLLARRAAVAASRRGVDEFLARWPTLRRQERVATALHLVGRDRAGLVARLEAFLVSGGRDAQLAAIGIARRLRVVADLETALVGCLAGADRHVASAAVMALADGDATQSQRVGALRRALDHDDARVAANAVEALARIDAATIDDRDDLLASRENRVRANAVRARVRRQPLSECLPAMLADPDPRHRVSAVWVAARSRAPHVRRDLGRLARADRFLEIRTRAEAALRWLQAC